ncbi:hypothetical protein FGO68_gene11210 [Halteria grandinella]|uniref:Uncharacterized protein n=1 Tax=Halteria grandinella TaxID=5974 RepID=A0A8J8NLU5_HALGN|nr:hypothetical protein FGO68_gene11210 [Halteria grandinella]
MEEYKVPQPFKYDEAHSLVENWINKSEIDSRNEYADDIGEDHCVQVDDNPPDEEGTEKDYAIRMAKNFAQSNGVNPSPLDFADLYRYILCEDLGVDDHPKAEIIKDLQQMGVVKSFYNADSVVSNSSDSDEEEDPLERAGNAIQQPLQVGAAAIRHGPGSMDGNGTGSTLGSTLHMISTTGSAAEELDPQTIFDDPDEASASKGAKAGSPNKGN